MLMIDRQIDSYHDTDTYIAWLDQTDTILFFGWLITRIGGQQTWLPTGQVEATYLIYVV